MLLDVVVDTCVFSHATNETTGIHYDTASAFVVDLAGGSAHICLDEGVALPPNNSTSLLWCEYRDLGLLAVSGDLYGIFAGLLGSNRIDEIRIVNTPLLAELLRRCIADSRDRKLIKIAAASRSKVLVTHDDGFLARCSAEEIRAVSGVRIVNAAEARELLAD